MRATASAWRCVLISRSPLTASSRRRLYCMTSSTALVRSCLSSLITPRSLASISAHIASRACCSACIPASRLRPSSATAEIARNSVRSRRRSTSCTHCLLSLARASAPRAKLSSRCVFSSVHAWNSFCLCVACVISAVRSLLSSPSNLSASVNEARRSALSARRATDSREKLSSNFAAICRMAPSPISREFRSSSKASRGAALSVRKRSAATSRLSSSTSFRNSLSTRTTPSSSMLSV
mmetsp:Transcript_12406/g.20287  ORF Transcript_12406/g.20287 Transcript_12406/m.20287 type:complete len:238 (+) Transcript_12406:5485-6198(+)